MAEQPKTLCKSFIAREILLLKHRRKLSDAKLSDWVNEYLGKRASAETKSKISKTASIGICAPGTKPQTKIIHTFSEFLTSQLGMSDYMLTINTEHCAISEQNNRLFNPQTSATDQIAKAAGTYRASNPMEKFALDFCIERLDNSAILIARARFASRARLLKDKRIDVPTEHPTGVKRNVRNVLTNNYFDIRFLSGPCWVDKDIVTIYLSNPRIRCENISIQFSLNHLDTHHSIQAAEIAPIRKLNTQRRIFFSDTLVPVKSISIELNHVNSAQKSDQSKQHLMNTKPENARDNSKEHHSNFLLLKNPLSIGRLTPIESGCYWNLFLDPASIENDQYENFDRLSYDDHLTVLFRKTSS